MADLLRAGPGPDPARHLVPPPGRQDPGLRLPPGPPAHPAHPRARSGAGGHGHGPRLPAQRRPDRSDRPGPRLRARPRRPCQRGRTRPVPPGRLRPRALGGARLVGPAQSLRPDHRRHRQSQLVPSRTVHPRRRGGQLGRPRGLRLPRLGGRRADRHRVPPPAPRRSSATSAGNGAVRSWAPFIHGVVAATLRSGQVGMEEDAAEALAAFRACNYERIYLRDASLRQGEAVVARPAGTGRALRRPAAPDRRDGGRRRSRTSSPGASRRSRPPSPTWPA